jgi:hypothetical protein
LIPGAARLHSAARVEQAVQVGTEDLIVIGSGAFGMIVEEE